MRSLAGHRRQDGAALPDGSAFSAALRRGPLGRIRRRAARLYERLGGILRPLNGTALALVFLAGSIGYGMALGGQYKVFLNEVGSAAGFGVRQIEIRGLAESSEVEIVDRIDVTTETSLLFLDPERARLRIAEIPWLADVTVKKVYPDKLVVNLRERKPFALWQDDGRIKVVDASGSVMSEVVKERYADLPLVVGVGANARADEAIRLMNSAPTLRGKLRAAVLVAERRWNLVTVDGVEIRLPEIGPADALAQVAMLNETKRLLDRDIMAVDMRTPERLYIKLTDAAATARREAIKQRQAKKKGAAT